MESLTLEPVLTDVRPGRLALAFALFPSNRTPTSVNSNRGVEVAGTGVGVAGTGV